MTDPLAARVVARFALRTASSLWYHLTDRSKFKLDPKFKPADNAVAIEDRSGQPGIYLGQSVAYAREEYGEPGWIESSLGVEFDTGEPIIERGHDGWAEAQKKYKGYHYPGPDVRSMPGAEVTRLKKQLHQVKR